MSEHEWQPGQLVVVAGFSLVRRFRSEEEHYTARHQNAMVVQKTCVLFEGDCDEWALGPERGLSTSYLVLFSNDMRMYYVGCSRLLHPSSVEDPSRLFGRHPQ